MGIANKVKYLDITADTTIQQIADALGCEGFTHSFNDVSYGIIIDKQGQNENKQT